MNRGGDRVDAAFRVTIVAATAATLGIVGLGLHGHGVLPAVDLALDTLSMLMAVILTALAWSRFREQRRISAVYQAAAFLALSFAYATAVAVSLIEGEVRDTLADPADVQTLVFAIARLAAAVLFVISGTFTHRRTYGHLPLWILVAPTVAVALAGVVGLIVGEPPTALRLLGPPDASGLSASTPFGALVHVTTACLFFAGAYASRSLWRRGGVELDGWLAVGLLWAGFGELNWTIYPSAHPGQVSTADLFRLGFSLILLVGLEVSVRSNLRQLRAANAELAELRVAEVERAALEERTRLARELHDGLAQDLWLAKLRTAELVTNPDLTDDARRAAEAAAAAIDIGLGEARDAVAALRSVPRSGTGLADLIRRAVEDSADRYGLRVEFTADGADDQPIAARTQAEVLRITQEALTNVARHANATVVGVRLAIRDGRISLRVVDNGRGFDPRGEVPAGFGLTSMRERAALIGGRLRILSRDGAGTRVVMSAPFGRSAAEADA